MERDVADARAQVAATVAAEKQSIDRAKNADKKLEEAKIVFSAAKQESAALQTKIKSLTAELSSAQTKLQLTASALHDATQSKVAVEDELRVIKSQQAAGSASLEQQLHSVESACVESQAQVAELRSATRALQEEVDNARSSAAAKVNSLEAKLAETKAAHSSETSQLKLRLSAAETLSSVHQQQQQQLQQQHQQECARQERERAFTEHKMAILEEQTSAAAAAQAAAAAATAEAEVIAAAAKERVAAVAAVFKKMANLDEGLEGSCTCLQCMQALADPVLLQVTAPTRRAPPSPDLFCCSAGIRCAQHALLSRGHAPSATRLSSRLDAISVAPSCHASRANSCHQKPMSNIALGNLISKLNFRRQVMEQLLTKHAVA